MLLACLFPAPPPPPSSTPAPCHPNRDFSFRNLLFGGKPAELGSRKSKVAHPPPSLICSLQNRAPALAPPHPLRWGGGAAGGAWAGFTLHKLRCRFCCAFIKGKSFCCLGHSDDKTSSCFFNVPFFAFKITFPRSHIPISQQ